MKETLSVRLSQVDESGELLLAVGYRHCVGFSNSTIVLENVVGHHLTTYWFESPVIFASFLNGQRAYARDDATYQQ